MTDARIRARRGAVVMLTFWLVLALPVAARAHSGTESYLYLDVYDTAIEGRIEFPIADLNEILGIEIPDDEMAASVYVAENLDLLQGYAAEHLSIGEAGDEWPIVFDGHSFVGVAAGSYVVFDFVVDRDFDSVPRQFDVTYDGIIHAKDDRNALLLIGTDWGSGTFANEASELLRYTPNSTTQTVDLGGSSFWKGMLAVIGLGVEHIQIGSDHILFIVALVLPAVLVYRRPEGWLPAPTFGSSLWRVLKIVTMFTLAHTITLTLGGLGIIELPGALVETVIAISIALAALHNIRPQFFNKEWLIAFGFGLFHGFGFAGLLGDLGLTQSRRFFSLLGFNIGIEVGQAIIIVLIFPSLYLLRRTRFYVNAMKAGSALLVFIALGWALDRGLGVNTGIDEVMIRVFKWPRPLLIIAVVTVISIAVALRERNGGRLIPVAPDSQPELATEGESVRV